MATLTAARRNKLPQQSFAIPEHRAYPIHDKAHAQNALARVKQHGSPAEQRRVIAAVRRRYPGIEVETKPSKAQRGAVVRGPGLRPDRRQSVTVTRAEEGAVVVPFEGRSPQEVIGEALAQD